MQFFSAQELDSYEDNVKKGCAKCKLDKKCKNPKIRVSGKGRKKTLIVGDYPGEQDDQLGRNFMGDANVDFLNLLRSKGFDPFEDFWFINAVNCRKSNDRDATLVPTDVEIKNCRPYVQHIITTLKPTNIILLGETKRSPAVISFFPFLDTVTVDTVRGMSIPDQTLKAWVHTTISPRTIMKQNFDKNLKSVYMRDIDSILKNLNRPFPVNSEPVIKSLYKCQDVVDWMERVLHEKRDLYIDYEATGLKPYNKGHKLVSMSIGYMEKGLPITVSFPYQYRDFFTYDEQQKIKFRIKKILVSGLRLAAHNIKFEDSWSRNIFKMRPQNWYFDTQIAAHIIDNRKYITGLKPQVYFNFGIRPYNSQVQPFLEAVDGTEFNRVEEIRLPDLLKYGGLDSAYGLLLKQKQEEILTDRGLWEPYHFFHKGTLLMSDMQERGIHINEEYYHEQDKSLSGRIKALHAELLHSKEARLFKKKTARDIDIASGKDLGELFYTHLRMKKVYTANQNLCVDKATLEKFDNPFVKSLLYYRKLVKAKDTYFAQFIREVYDGRMNPFFNLHIPVSYRSSSSAPNFQNIPTRDDEIKKLIRSGITASPGRQLLFWDGKGMEVCTSVCYHQDPSMIKYITDTSTDMHRDTAADIWLLPHDEVSKDIRFYAKNSWVFAQFYGSYWLDCGTTLWETCIESLDLKTKSGIPLRQHMLDKKITNMGEFLEHCKEVERIFWKERFKAYDQWKRDINDEYIRNGYITSKLGFVYGGIMNRKQVSNYPIQGTAFHLLLWSLLEIEKISIENRWKSNLIAQIHDEGISDAVPEEIPEIIAAAKFVTEVKMPRVFPWINVPFGIDISSSPLNGSWYDKKELDTNEMVSKHWNARGDQRVRHLQENDLNTKLALDYRKEAIEQRIQQMKGLF